MTLDHPESLYFRLPLTLRATFAPYHPCICADLILRTRGQVEVLFQIAHRDDRALVTHHPLDRLHRYACLGQQRGKRAAQSVRRDPLDRTHGVRLVHDLAREARLELLAILPHDYHSLGLAQRLKVLD
jgi:hypothetical protein